MLSVHGASRPRGMAANTRSPRPHPSNQPDIHVPRSFTARRTSMTHCCCRTAPRPPGAGRRAPLALPVLACRGHARQCHARRCHARRAGHARHVATCTHAAPGLLPLLSSRHHQSRMHSCRMAQNNAIARRVRCVVNRAVIVYRVTSRRISNPGRFRPVGYAFIYRNHSSPRCYSLSYSLGVSYSLYPPSK